MSHACTHARTLRWRRQTCLKWFNVVPPMRRAWNRLPPPRCLDFRAWNWLTGWARHWGTPVYVGNYQLVGWNCWIWDWLSERTLTSTISWSSCLFGLKLSGVPKLCGFTRLIGVQIKGKKVNIAQPALGSRGKLAYLRWAEILNGTGCL